MQNSHMWKHQRVGARLKVVKEMQHGIMEKSIFGKQDDMIPRNKQLDVEKER